MFDLSDIAVKIIAGLAVLAVMPAVTRMIMPHLHGAKGAVICLLAVVLGLSGAYYALTVSLPGVNASKKTEQDIPAKIDRSMGKRIYDLSVMAESGDINAQYELAEYLRENFDIGSNKEGAFYWYEKAARAGHQKACFRLGGIYRGLYGPEIAQRDYSLALSWYNAGADSGGTDSQYELYSMYLRGEGVRKNPRMAYAYLYLMMLTTGNKLDDALNSELARLKKALPQGERGQAVSIAERKYRFIRRNYPEALK